MMTYKHTFPLQLLLLGILSSPLANAAINAEKARIHDYLKTLSIEDLVEVETRLDETFDVFDGLVKVRRVHVATGEEQSIAKAPAVTSVITAQDIEVMGARTLDEVLQSVPGLQVSYNWYDAAVYTIRGISSAFNPEVLVLSNGIRTNNNYTGSKSIQDWTGIPLSTIARIEIIRGPGSALYGADAFAGVINVITKSAQDIDGTEIGVRVGNYHTRDGWVVHGSEWNGFELVMMADFSDTEGHRRSVESDAQTIWDEVFGTDVSLAPGPYGSRLTTYDARVDIGKGDWRLRTGFHRGKDLEVGVGIAQALDPGKPKNNEVINADLSYSNPEFTDTSGLEVQLSFQRLSGWSDYQIFPPGAFGGAYPIGYLGVPGVAERQAELSLSGFYHGFDNHLIRMGAGYADYDLYKSWDKRNFGPNPFTGGEIAPTEMVDVSDTFAVFIPEVARQKWYAFVQDTWAIDAEWELTAGIRYDKYSDFGSTTNPRLGLVWEPRSEFVTKLLYGRAFRAPAFQDLYNNNNPVAIGNPDLGPEKIATWELAFDYRVTPALNLVLNLFRYDIEDKIALIPIGEANFGYANAAAWSGHGGEFELRWKTSRKSSLLLNYSYQDSEDDSGAPLANAPQQAAYLRTDYLLGTNWYLDAQANWNDGWQRPVNDPRPALDGYTTVDVMLRRKAARAGKTNFAVGVRNLFDTDVRYPSPGPDAGSDVVNVPNDLPGAGRFYFAEYRYTFK